MYLIEALKHNVPALHEDRLTQIVAATFNESNYFQRRLLRFLNVPYEPRLRAETQVSSDVSKSRPDLIIFEGTGPYILIESKVSAKSDREQQRRHSRIKSKYNFLITKDVVTASGIGRNFKKVSWIDFFNSLRLDTNKSIGEVDRFLIEKIVNFAKECGLLFPDRISKTDFEQASAFMTQIRIKKNPLYSLDKSGPFQALDNISKFLERTLEKVKEDSFLSFKVMPFTRKLNLSCAFDLDLETELKKARIESKPELKLKSDIISIEKEIRLKRSVNGHHMIFVRASFVPYNGNRNLSDDRLKQLNAVSIDKVAYRCKISAGLCGSDRVFSEDYSLTFDDSSDLDFSKFYLEAVKFWKRNLSVKR